MLAKLVTFPRGGVVTVMIVKVRDRISGRSRDRIQRAASGRRVALKAL